MIATDAEKDIPGTTIVPAQRATGDRRDPPRRAHRVVVLAGLVAGFVLAGVGLAQDRTSTEPRHEVLVVVGAPGAGEFAAGFAEAAEHWRAACAEAEAACTIVGTNGAGGEAGVAESTHDRDAVASWFASLDPDAAHPAWFVYIGHGTWDGREARLNLRGADLTGTELKLLVERLGERPTVVIHGGSASGPLVPLLSAPNRVVITATASGDEVNYARLGERLAGVIGASASEGDLDMDGQVSILEAFIAAARGVELFYAGEGRLATEHALIDDNGDGRGTPPEFYRGARLVRRASDSTQPDGGLARRIALIESTEERALTDEQRTRRDALEADLEALRARKATMNEADYLRDLEVLLRQLAALYAETGRDT